GGGRPAGGGGAPGVFGVPPPQPVAQPGERLTEVGGAQGTAVAEALHLLLAEAGSGAFEDGDDLLIEEGDPQRRPAAVRAGAQAGDQSPKPAHLRGVAQ